MAFATITSAQATLLGAQVITIEADLTKGLHAFTIVGLPDKAVEESRDRVSAAIKNSNWKSPKQRNQKITIALAPANLKKEGPAFDLPIALCYLLATAFNELLPQLSEEETLEVTAIHSVAGALKQTIITHPTFRSPHHTASYVSVIGGGAIPKPGEVTLAHRGVLFLDEFPEFDKRVIESLRQPLEDGVVHIARAKGSATFPSNFILVAAMNPCPCGNTGSKTKVCVCKPSDLDRYRRKLSGPIMDRIDLWVSVADVDYQKLGEAPTGETSDRIKSRVERARDIQKNRFKNAGRGIQTNSEMGVKDLEKIIPIAKDVRETLDKSAEALGLSARAYHRVIKIARTIADLEGAPEVLSKHILEAIQYRP